jgi:hypothetical protein
VFPNPLIFFVLTGTTWVHLMINWITTGLVTWRTLTEQFWSKAAVWWVDQPFTLILFGYWNMWFFRKGSIFWHRMTFSFLSYMKILSTIFSPSLQLLYDILNIVLTYRCYFNIVSTSHTRSKVIASYWSNQLVDMSSLLFLSLLKLKALEWKEKN